MALPFIPRGAHLLDVGCADGAQLRSIADRLHEGVGIDPDVDERREQNLWFRKAAFSSDLGVLGSFDVILCLAVMEHIPRERQADFAGALYSNLKPDGRLILTVPSRWVDPILAILMRLRILDGIEAGQHFGFRPDEVEPVMRSAGFRTVAHRTFQLGLNHLFVFSRPR